VRPCARAHGRAGAIACPTAIRCATRPARGAGGLGLPQLGGGEREARELTLLADWLVRNAQGGPRGLGVAWYTFPALPAYGVGATWPSAESQGLAISALLSAHDATGEAEYLETARPRSRRSRWTSPRAACAATCDDVVAFEGIPAEDPALPLGAWCHAIVALRELASRGELEAGDLATAGLAGLRAYRAALRDGDWFLRSLHPMPGPDLRAGPTCGARHRYSSSWSCTTRPRAPPGAARGTALAGRLRARGARSVGAAVGGAGAKRRASRAVSSGGVDGRWTVRPAIGGSSVQPRPAPAPGRPRWAVFEGPLPRVPIQRRPHQAPHDRR
jgi:hypothetical protein